MRVSAKVGRRRKRAFYYARAPLSSTKMIPLDELPSFLANAINHFRERHPKSYKAHEGFLETVLEDADLLAYALKMIWRGYGRGKAKNLFVCTDNVLGRSPSNKFCVIIGSLRENGRLYVSKVIVGNAERPGKWASWYIYLDKKSEWSPEDLEMAVEELLRYAGTF